MYIYTHMYRYAYLSNGGMCVAQESTGHTLSEPGISAGVDATTA